MSNNTLYGGLLIGLGDLKNRLVSNRSVVLAAFILVPILAFSVAAPHVAPYDPTETDPFNKFEKPSLEHPMGTDNLGRDIFSRVLYGGRTSLFLGFSATFVGLLFGIPIGLSTGYVGGWVDDVVMRVMDALMSFPSLLLALLILSTLSSNIWNAIIAIGIVFTPRIARVVRSSTLSVKNEEFIEAAQSRGDSHTYIVFGEIFPNVLSPVIVEGSIRVGFAILIGTSLSFLGLGTQPPNPDWGYMVAVSQEYMWQSPLFLFWPSLMLGLTILSLNLLGDGLRDVLDPRIHS